MIEIDISRDQSGLVIGPEDTWTDIIQSVRTILTTRKGTLPLDRDFGVSWDMVDLPTPNARAALTAELADQVERYEPRVKVTKIAWEHAASDEMTGKLVPRVWIEVIS